MELPKDRLYTTEHEWVKVEGQEALIGITHFAQGELGELVFVEPPSTGKSLVKGDTACVVESTKAASDVYAPISGTVLATNELLVSEPTAVNTDPYGKGWLVRVTGVVATDLVGLMNSEEYSKFLQGKGA